MVISQLINSLKEAQAKLGDVEVVIMDLDWHDCRSSDYSWPTVESVEMLEFQTPTKVAVCSPYDNSGLVRF